MWVCCGSVGRCQGPWIGCCRGACVVLSSVGEEHVGGAAEGWLVWDAVRKVAVRRCRMWCMMLVVGCCRI